MLGNRINPLGEIACTKRFVLANQKRGRVGRLTDGRPDACIIRSRLGDKKKRDNFRFIILLSDH